MDHVERGAVAGGIVAAAVERPGGEQERVSGSQRQGNRTVHGRIGPEGRIRRLAHRKLRRRVVAPVRSGDDRQPVVGGEGDAEMDARGPLHALSLERRIVGKELGVAMPETVPAALERSEEHTSELQTLMRISSAVYC